MLTELTAAEAIRDGRLQSPQKFGAMWLFAIRITGTGLTYRVGLNEYCWRDPSIYLNDEFLARCNGLPVIWGHPDKSSLNSKEFANRVIGSVMLAYIVGDEVRAIARIYDADAIEAMRNKQMSTSPAVLFRPNDPGVKKELDDGTRLFVEGDPVVLDHIAICDQGVWDKGGDPTGVDIGGSEVATTEESEALARKDAEEKARKDAEKEAAPGGGTEDLHKSIAEILGHVKKLTDCYGEMSGRMDAIEKGKPGDTKEADEMRAEKERQDKARADAEKERMDAEEMKRRMDALESAVAPKPRTDAEEAEMAEEQSRMDAVYSAFGKRAPAPLPGEMPDRYRSRLASGLKSHSKTWKPVDLSGLSSDALKIAAEQIRNDAAAAAASPAVEDGVLVARVETSAAGHRITRFIGSYDAANAPFKRRMQRVASFNPNHGRAA